MRKIISVLIILLSISIIVTIAYLIYERVNDQKRICSKPDISFILVDNSTFHINDNKKRLVVSFFNPGCNHCENEAEVISKYRNKLPNTEILMVSFSPRDSIKAYAKRHRLVGMPNIHFATDSLIKAYTLFGVQTIPTTFIYGSHGRLIKRFNGEVSIKALLRELR